MAKILDRYRNDLPNSTAVVPYTPPVNHRQYDPNFARQQWEKYYGQQTPGVETTPNNASGLGGLFRNINLFSPALEQKISNGTNNLLNPQFDWNAKKGLQGWGKNLGGYATAINGGIQGIRALSGISDLSKGGDVNSDLQADIVTAAANSPLLYHDLNAEQRQLLGELRRGTYDGKMGLDNLGEVDLLGVLGDTAMGALTGLPGGWIGALVGGAGGLVNSIIGDLGAEQSRNNAELESLYQAVLDSERQYKDMKKQQAYARLMQY